MTIRNGAGCCCGCTLLTDTFNRDPSDPTQVDTDGVNFPGFNTYTFDSGSWGIIPSGYAGSPPGSYQLKCLSPSGNPITLWTEKGILKIESTFNNVGDYLELSDGTYTLRKSIVTGVSGMRALKTEFDGAEEYLYNNLFNITNAGGLALPYSTINEIREVYCDTSTCDSGDASCLDWNKSFCDITDGSGNYVTADDRAYSGGTSTNPRNTIHIVRDVPVDLISPKTWTLKSNNCTFRNLTVTRNSKDCIESYGKCVDICDGGFPSSVEVTLGGLPDVYGAIFPPGPDYPGSSFCAGHTFFSGCQTTYYACIAANGGSDYPDCSCYAAKLGCECDSYDAQVQCQLLTPGTSLNGTHVLDLYTPAPSGLTTDASNSNYGTACRVYETRIPLPNFYVASDVGCFGQDNVKLGTVQSGSYSSLSCTMYYRYYNSVNPRRAQYSYIVNVPLYSNTAGGNITLRPPVSSGVQRYVEINEYCNGGSMSLDANGIIAANNIDVSFTSVSLYSDELAMNIEGGSGPVIQSRVNFGDASVSGLGDTNNFYCKNIIETCGTGIDPVHPLGYTPAPSGTFSGANGSRYFTETCTIPGRSPVTFALESMGV